MIEMEEPFDVHTRVYQHLRDYRNELTPPPGFDWPEISNGELVMMMSPSLRHDLNTHKISQQLRKQAGDGYFIEGFGDVEDVPEGKLRRPDVVVFPEDAINEEASSIDPRWVVLAVEMVSPSNPENDYDAKTWDYPAMGIPHYLIVDPREGTCLYQYKPDRVDGRAQYTARVPYVFGDVIEVNGWTIDTGQLLRYTGKEKS